LIEIELFTGY